MLSFKHLSLSSYCANLFKGGANPQERWVVPALQAGAQVWILHVDLTISQSSGTTHHLHLLPLSSPPGPQTARCCS